MENVHHAALCSSLPFSTPLCKACLTIYPSAQSLPRHGVVSDDWDKPTKGGVAGSWGSGKNASLSSSILQPYLVKGNNGQHIPSCHWKRRSGALAWHANIVACTNDDAKLTSLFIASLMGGKVWTAWKAEDVQEESNYQQVDHVCSKREHELLLAQQAGSEWPDLQLLYPKWYECLCDKGTNIRRHKHIVFE